MGAMDERDKPTLVPTSTTQEINMKTTTVLTRFALITLLGAAIAMPVLAQSGAGMGGGMGMGMRNADQGTGTMGQGRGHGGRGMRLNQNNAQASALMTAEERTAHQTNMRAVKTYDECKQVQTEQHKLMALRAKDKGITLPAPRQNGCDNMKARGFIN
jgi:hypothetical protein